jgi:hypothetical protein
MLIQDHTNGALECILFQDELIILVKALEALDEEGFDERYTRADEPILRGLRSTLEMVTHTCAIINRTANDPNEIKRVFRQTRKEFGVYSISEEDEAPA